ncbi:MAG: Hsp20/alpha crystallin family protein [Lachnospiraceae bacterium]|nr:Hsp20/alpha crystallin family protein [Lachnospiraceae bacterium]MBR6270830.1 Hsp20/alpha crystallin family protein [Lachnospiraceae bacterium]
MFMPSIFGENLFDDWFDFPAERKLYRGHADRIMKTDVREDEDHFELDIDLPGYKKEELSIELKNGYLSVGAEKTHEETENDKNGKLIRQERYTGTMQRSFYVGRNITEDDIKASFKDGVLNLNIPKKAAPIPEKKTIMIEG